jgi:predicted dienelactone hydrolase
LVLALAILAACARRPLPHSAYSDPGPYEVRVVDETWYDASRSRAVPVRMYVPAGVANPPVVVFSHGTGNGRDGYRYLGMQWASHGYLSVHPEHVGAGRDVARRGILANLFVDDDPQLHEIYPLDLRFVIDHLGCKRVAVAGHSMGAYAVLALAGLKVGGESFRDPRVVAGIPISMSEEFDHAAYADIRIPLLHITGTRDMSLVYGTLPRHRRVPFDSIEGGGDEYLVTIGGATHSTPSDEEDPSNRRAHDIIRASTTAFLDGYLKGDVRAVRWLNGNGLAHFVDGDARVEIK